MNSTIQMQANIVYIKIPILKCRQGQLILKVNPLDLDWSPKLVSIVRVRFSLCFHLVCVYIEEPINFFSVYN